MARSRIPLFCIACHDCLLGTCQRAGGDDITALACLPAQLRVYSTECWEGWSKIIDLWCDIFVTILPHSMKLIQDISRSKCPCRKVERPAFRDHTWLTPTPMGYLQLLGSLDFGVPEESGHSSDDFSWTSLHTQLPNMFFIFINLLLFSRFSGHSCIVIWWAHRQLHEAWQLQRVD
jgi:hypothetical protein